MRTVTGLARRLQRPGGRGRADGPVRAVTARGVPLVGERLGEQRRGGARLDQVSGTTCGSAVLVALAAWADPAELARLDGGPAVTAGASAGVAAGFGDRFDARQLEVHRATNRRWPRALGTTPWGMARWLREHVPAAGPYRVRLVDDVSRADVDLVTAAVGAALAAGHPVPLLVGRWLPRHWVMGTGVMATGVTAPGVMAPGVTAPGVTAPGVMATGVMAPGVMAAGVRAPEVTAPLSMAAGDQATGVRRTRGPAATAPGATGATGAEPPVSSAGTAQGQAAGAAGAGAAAEGAPAPVPLGEPAGRWRVYEPSSGHVRALDVELVRERRLATVLGFDRLHAVLLPA
jgi:hypothetical protein